jgi:hypothetical protein
MALIVFLAGNFPGGTGFLAAPTNATSLQPSMPPTTVFTPSATPTPTIAPGSIGNDTCFQCKPPIS